MHCFSKSSVVPKEDSHDHAGDVASGSGPIKPSAQYIDALSKRRSIYSLDSTLPQSDKEVIKTIEDTIRQCPSSFNVKSSRAVILFGADHQKVWTIVKAALKKVTTEEQYAESEMKVNNCFAAGAGTILFYEDSAAIKIQQQTYPRYAASMLTFSQHASAMAQFAVWSALAQDGIGASLQHYNELIETELRTAFDIPEDWQLIAQMPFGSIKTPADAKPSNPDENRVVVRGASV
ncbi:putative Nitroreductase family [Leishmania naiffi]|uniref:Nitroreductase family n=1 Tax=Leishmania naiffi TaxID=5678 RepID=A0AAW3B6C9_9TRYP